MNDMFAEKTFNMMRGNTDWKGVCQISKLLTNGLERRKQNGKKKDLCYISNDSLGGREICAEKKSQELKDGFGGSWEGYAEKDSQAFIWRSGRSMAELRATKIRKNEWDLLFVGCDTAEKERESAYLLLFILAINIESLEVLNIEDSKVITLLIENDINHRAEKEADKLRLFQQHFDEQMAS